MGGRRLRSGKAGEPEAGVRSDRAVDLAGGEAGCGSGGGRRGAVGGALFWTSGAQAAVGGGPCSLNMNKLLDATRTRRETEALTGTHGSSIVKAKKDCSSSPF